MDSYYVFYVRDVVIDGCACARDAHEAGSASASGDSRLGGGGDIDFQSSNYMVSFLRNAIVFLCFLVASLITFSELDM